MLTEPAESSMGVRLNITTQTDQSINREQQQAEMLIDYGPYTVSNPQQQIKTVVLQNRNWLDARWNSKPQYVMPNWFTMVTQSRLYLLGGVMNIGSLRFSQPMLLL